MNSVAEAGRGPGVKAYPHIFSGGKLGPFTTKNRVKYAACSVSNFNGTDGSISAREYSRMEVIVRTGAGIITNQGAYPDARGEGKAYLRQVSIADDRYIPGLEKIAGMIHSQGALALQQLLHGGRYGGIELGYCMQASDVAQTLKHFRPPKAMSKGDIAQCISEHAAAAERAVRAGFDGVEITGFMGYLVSNFNSKFTNSRKDEYGGSVENRARFMCELLGGIRDAVGKEKAIAIRLNGVELMDEYGGNTPDECVEMMRHAGRAGADCISIVVGWHESRTGALGRDVPSGKWLYLAEAARRAVAVPIAFGPRFGSPELGEEALAKGTIDFWELCRPFLADPQMLRKVSEGRRGEVRPCMGDLLCLSRMFRNLPYICCMNPALGHEGEASYRIRPAERQKRVMVIGGGPAGIECALAAAARGHRVTVWERAGRIGGALHMASREVEGGFTFTDLVKFYETALAKAGVEVRTGTEATRDTVRKAGPDVVVLAAGARFEVPQSVHIGGEALLVPDILEGGKNVTGPVVVVGGNRAGLVCAEHLASKGLKVTVIEEGKDIAGDVIPTFKWRHAAWVKEYGITVLASTRVVAVDAGGVRTAGPDGKEGRVEAAAVVFAVERRPENALLAALEFLCDELYVIGDAVAPRSLHNAVHEGYRLGAEI